MRSRVIIVLLALALSPWAPVADCAVSARPWARAAEAPTQACCCDDAPGRCAMPEASSARPAPSAADGAPCCRATNAPVPAVPASALDASTAPQPLVAIVTPGSTLSPAADADARRVMTTEAPPGSRPSSLETDRLRL